MEFIYKRKDILVSLIYGYFLLVFTFFLFVMISRKIILDWNEFNLYKIIFAYSFVILFGLLTFQNLGIALIRKKYYLINQKREINLNTNEKQILITNKTIGTIETVDFNKVKSVELYYSWNTHTFSSDLGYSKILVENESKPIIITQNNINQYEIYKIFKSKVTKTKYRFANNINKNFC